MDYCKEAKISCDKISITSKDRFYKYTFQNAELNSLRRQLKLGSVIIKPFLGEQAFANKAHYQKDRYDVVLNGIVVKNIDMKSLPGQKIIASDLIIDKVSTKIYTDLRKPLSGKSKIGNSPAQLLKKIHIPINISRAVLSNTFIEYREKEILTGSTGDVKFSESIINMNNITNIPEAIQKNNAMEITFESKALRTIPINGRFTFFLDNHEGKFTADGHISAFDVHLLNEVSVPMALIRLNTGIINSIDFNFKGSNHEAGGKLVMKYNDLKIDLLRRDKKSNDIKKKGLKSLVANIIVKNDNPHNGNLREVIPHSDRNIQKSFFNLLWKTIFEGMKKTAGIP